MARTAGGVKNAEAEALLRSVLAGGPMAAGEIIAVAEGAKFARRTVQLAATNLQVVREKDGTRGGWVWSLPDSIVSDAMDMGEIPKIPDSLGDEYKAPTRCGESHGAEQPSDGEADKVLVRVEPSPGQSVVERAKFIAAMLNKREERRAGIRGRFHWQDPRVQSWAAAGVRDYHLTEAYDLATRADDFDGAVTAGALGQCLETVMADEGANFATAIDRDT